MSIFVANFNFESKNMTTFSTLCDLSHIVLIFKNNVQTLIVNFMLSFEVLTCNQID
jgi:hypothetical protein